MSESFREKGCRANEGILEMGGMVPTVALEKGAGFLPLLFGSSSIAAGPMLLL